MKLGRGEGGVGLGKQPGQVRARVGAVIESVRVRVRVRARARVKRGIAVMTSA